MIFKAGRTVSVCVLISGLCACAVVKNPTPVQSVPPPETDWEYEIQIGDELDVKFFYNPELNEQVTVRPDGRISLQLVPEIYAANMTARELTEVLREQYEDELAEPRIAVIVRTFSAQRVYVGGEVNRPGEMALVGPLTVLQAVARAEGFKDTARLAEVIVIRRKPDKTPLVVPVNVKDAINGIDLSQDIQLMPYDVVFVPRSIIANVNKWVAQYVTNNIPFSFGFRVELTF